MTNKEINEWQVATIVLVILIGCLVIYSFLPLDSEMEIDGVRVKQSQLDAFKDNMQVGQSATICNLEDKKCTTITKIK